MNLNSDMHRFLQRWLLACFKVYIGAVALSVVIAHVLLVVRPHSNVGERIISPVVRALAFLDVHWKSALVLFAPFLMPLARDLIPRLRKAWGLEFYRIELETVGVHEKPVTPSPGAAI